MDEGSISNLFFMHHSWAHSNSLLWKWYLSESIACFEIRNLYVFWECWASGWLSASKLGSFELRFSQPWWVWWFEWQCHSWAWLVKYLVPNCQCYLCMCRRCGLARKFVLEADFEVSKLPITPSSLSQPPDWSLIGDFSTLFRPPCLSPMHCHKGV